MEGNKDIPRFHTSNNELDTSHEAFGNEANFWIPKLGEQAKIDKKYSEAILRESSFKGLSSLVSDFLSEGAHISFTNEVIQHIHDSIQNSLLREGSMQETKIGNVATLLENLLGCGFPKESMVDIIHNIVLEYRDNSGEQEAIFREKLKDVEILFFIKSLISEDFSRETIVTPEIQRAALFRVLSQKGQDGNMCSLIKLFDLSGGEVTTIARSWVESLISSGHLTVRTLQELYLQDTEYEYTGNLVYGSNDSDESLQGAWEKLQKRYEITESYQEMKRGLFDRALAARDNVQIRNICNKQSAVLAELVTAETLPEIIRLAEDTFYVASNIKADLGGDSYSDKGWIIGAVLERFDIPLETIKKWFEYASDTNKLYLQRLCRETLDPDAILTLELLGVHASEGAYRFIKINRVGDEARIKELREFLARFKQDILQEDFDISQTLMNPVIHDFAQGYLRIDEREFGSSTLVESVDLYHRQKNKIEPLDKVIYQRSELLRIKTRGEQKDFKYSEQFLSAFHTLTEDIRRAHALALVVGVGERKKPLSALVEGLNQERDNAISKLYQSRGSLAEDRRQFIDNQIAILEAVNFRDLNKLDSNLQILAKIPEAHSIVRQLIFTFTFAKDDAENPYFPPEVGKRPSLDDITGVINFVDHIGYQETWKKYFKDKRSRNNFRQIASTRALEEELERMQKSSSGEIGSTMMKFVPTRGFLMEVSGSLADACWQDSWQYQEEYDEIHGNYMPGNRAIPLLALQYPNFTSVTFVQNPGTIDERIAGACMLIETLSRDSEKLLVIRGLNPLENVINRLSVEDFYQKFTEYCKGIAERGGRKLAIVIDAHSGGSATNRPALFQYLRNLQLRKVILENDADTRFNGYGIVDQTFLVE